MFTQEGNVIKIEDNKIIVACTKNKTCSCCRYSSICSKDGQESFVVYNSGALDVAEGDTVVVGIDEIKQFLGIALIFVFPLVLFVGMLVFLRALYPLANFFIAFFAVCIYYFFVKLFLLSNGKYFELKLIKVIKG
ncbi:MAG: SoxR reducing system RseC family protein [Candidatus Omnitrophica bacterium]|nr:SoxR reducing system RseC family protein [Candidatus Omnitrophota bacterium]